MKCLECKKIGHERNTCPFRKVSNEENHKGEPSKTNPRNYVEANSKLNRSDNNDKSDEKEVVRDEEQISKKDMRILSLPETDSGVNEWINIDYKNGSNKSVKVIYIGASGVVEIEK